MFRNLLKGFKARCRRTYLLSSFCDNYCIMINGKPYYFNCDVRVSGKKSPTPSLCGVSLEYAKLCSPFIGTGLTGTSLNGAVLNGTEPNGTELSGEKIS